jgi:hypothetical protein
MPPSEAATSPHRVNRVRVSLLSTKFSRRGSFLLRHSAIAPPPNSSIHSLRDWQHLNRILHFTSFNCTYRSHETVLWSLRSCPLRLSSRGCRRRPLFPRVVGALFTASDNHRLGFHNVAVLLLTACSKCRPCVTFFFHDSRYALFRAASEQKREPDQKGQFPFFPTKSL